MLVLALNPGHDGATAAVKDRKLVVSLESEKDSFPRHSQLTPTTLLNAIEYLGEVPDVVALSGWGKTPNSLGNLLIGAGYVGAQLVQDRVMNFFGKPVTLFSSSHERSHIMGAIGMAPRDEAPLRAVLVWEGLIGSFYLVDETWAVARELPVLSEPGERYAFLFALADPTFLGGDFARPEDSGKLMALAAYGDPREADRDVAETVERILEMRSILPIPKDAFRGSPLYNVGVEAHITKVAAALLTERIFEVFARVAREHLPKSIPLHIAGGCGLNCDWNVKWRELDHFSSVFVPPCPNDSGSAIGTAIDALANVTGDPFIEWDVYGGVEFEWDCAPDSRVWARRDMREDAVAEALADGRIFAWVQGRSEIGPRALGNRSILAEPFDPRTRDRLNVLKQREGYRPIGPCARLEDVGKVFTEDFEDPYMLYFRTARSTDLGAVTHIDGSARCQTVSAETNKPLHDLLSAFADHCGVGVLCNTSLNFKGLGFINRMSDLARYCETTGIMDVVVSDSWFQRAEGSQWWVGIAPAGRRRNGPPWHVLPPVLVERLRSALLAQGRLRDATIVSLLAYAGLRSRELFRLDWSDVGKEYLRVKGGKAAEEGRERRVRLLEPLAEDLALWRENCEEVGQEALVFTSSEGARWTAEEWGAWRAQIFVPTARSEGMKKLHPIELRNTFCCLLLFEGMSSRKLAAQMGTTTQEINKLYEPLRGNLVDGSPPASADEEIRRARSSDSAKALGAAGLS